MLETAETGETVNQETYDAAQPELRTKLVQMQLKLEKAAFPVLIIVSGDDSDSVRQVLNLISTWLDPRFVLTCVFGKPSEEERLRPEAWRYWHQLPRAGRIGVYANEWTTRLILQRLDGKCGDKRFGQSLDQIEHYERMLAVDGAVLLKLFLHAPAEELERKRKKIRDQRAWCDAAHIGRAMLQKPRATRDIIEEALQRTGTECAPWHLIETTCANYRNLTIARLLLDTINERLSATPATPVQAEASAVGGTSSGRKSVLDSVKLSAKLTVAAYDKEVAGLKQQIQKLTDKAHRHGVSTIAAFEGWDASGKGGTIRRLAQSMNPEVYRIVPIAAPNDEERAHHYLWRFWRQIPMDGGFVIFDRTWYGRVLVERVEGFASPAQWQRAYDEINHFEDRLVQHGSIVLKFWLHIDQDEQLRRFKAREKTPFKQFKIGPDDWRNREKWGQYVAAVNDMVARTSTPTAPWRLIPSNDKNFGRIEVLRQTVEALKERL